MSRTPSFVSVLLPGSFVLAALTLNVGNATAVDNDSIHDLPAPARLEIVGGSSVAECGWPTTVSTRGCTATLIHPKAISTAQHCGTPTRIYFGERDSSAAHSVAVAGCVTQGSDDAMICELAEAVTQVPVTPVLFGCEVDMYMKVGQPVVMVGFGQTSYGTGGGTKLWTTQTITAVESGRTIIGNAGEPNSPCAGDSGGPVFLQVSDGSWRVFGTVLGGTTSTPCNSAANFQRIDKVVPFFEQQRGLDITPCFDGQTGAWDPSPECGQFYAGDDTGAGTWTNWCPGTPESGASAICGPAYGDTGAADAGPGPGPIDGDAGVDVGIDGGQGGSANGDDEGGCGCRSNNNPSSIALLAMIVLLVTLRRRYAA